MFVSEMGTQGYFGAVLLITLLKRTGMCFLEFRGFFGHTGYRIMTRVAGIMCPLTLKLLLKLIALRFDLAQLFPELLMLA
jgi:hypothetical protein